MGSRDDFMSMGKFLDYILYSIMMIERLICKYINFPFGTCIFAVFKKRAADKELEGIY